MEKKKLRIGPLNCFHFSTSSQGCCTVSGVMAPHLLGNIKPADIPKDKKYGEAKRALEARKKAFKGDNLEFTSLRDVYE